MASSSSLLLSSSSSIVPVSQVDVVTDSTPVIPVSSPLAEEQFEQSLISLEKLDRCSPDMWPEQIPGLSEFVAIQTPPQKRIESPNAQHHHPKWLQNLDQEDLNLLHEFGSLTAANLIEEVHKLQNMAYQLGLEEAKEMTRGRYLSILELPSKK